MRAGACMVNPVGTAVSGSVVLMRMTSTPLWMPPVIDWIAFCACAHTEVNVMQVKMTPLSTPRSTAANPVALFGLFI